MKNAWPWKKVKKETRTKKAPISFWGKYRFHLLIMMVLSVILYIVVYFVFKGNGFIPTGKCLSKSDWLSFFGSYLSFVGTAIVSLIAILQSHYYAVTEERKKRDERQRQVQQFFY